MGFYGNITNTAKSQFTFDRIYSSRRAMDKNISADGIYIGRYVLVEYDSDVDDTYFIQLYLKEEKFYTSSSYESSTQARWTGESSSSGTTIKTGQIIKVWADNKWSFYKCSGADSNGYAVFTLLVKNTNNYTTNYNLDINEYGDGRGYDSTVWQKVYSNGSETYVMIAELNSVVPTFALAADPPTPTPITPHFDTDSTNVYYKLHWQPQWGMRVKEAKASSTTSSDTTQYPSDEKTYTLITNYDPETDKLTSKTSNYDGAIYYNKAGFNKGTRTYSDKSDSISITPSGISGNLYSQHDNSGEAKTSVDIQEITMMLPSLGNTICDIWDIIYGTSRNQDIDWDSTSGLRQVVVEDDGYTFNTANTTTLAGCINSVHDLMGMIIKTTVPSTFSNEDYNYIYYIGGKFYQYLKEYEYSSYTGNIAEATEDLYIGQLTNDDGNNIKEKDGFRSFAKWNKNVDYIEGIPLTTRQEITKRIELNEFANKLNTIHGLILRMNELLRDNEDLTNTRMEGTLQGSINLLEDIIAEFDELKPKTIMLVDNTGRLRGAEYNGDDWLTTEIDGNIDGPKISIKHTTVEVEETTSESDMNSAEGNTINLRTYTIDNAGHVTGENQETITLPYSFKTIKASNSTDVTNAASTTIDNGQIASSTQDTLTISGSNKWIKIDNNTEDTIKIGHEVTAFESGVANIVYGLQQDESLTTLDVDNVFEVPCLKFDEAGHITKAETHTVTLPETFNTISITGSSTSTDNSSNASDSLVAGSLTDTVTIAPGNKWIELKASKEDNKVEIFHYKNAFDETTSTADFNTSGTTFDIQSLNWDGAGHITSSTKTTYTLPNDFKTITIANNGSATTTSSTEANGKLVATTPIDTATVDSGNRWIQLVADTDNNKVSLSHNTAGTASTTVGDNSDQTPNFGSTFKVPYIGIDQTGHVGTLTDHTVKIPLPSLTNSDAGQVVTNLALTDTTGAFMESRSYLGALAITNYTLGTDSGALAETDTLNAALSKLQVQVNNGANAIDNLIGTPSGETINSNYDTIYEIADWITTNTDSTKDGIAKTLAVLNGDNTTSGSVAKTVKDAIDGLGYETKENSAKVSAADGKYVYAVHEADGKIEVLRASLPTYSLTAGDSNGTINWNGTAISITGLGDAAYTESSAYDAAGTAAGLFSQIDYSKKYDEKTTFDYGSTDEITSTITIPNAIEKIKNLEATVSELNETIASLLVRIKTLEEKTNNNQEEATPGEGTGEEQETLPEENSDNNNEA